LIGGTSIGDGRVDHGVEQRLHALVLEGRAAQHRHELQADRRLAHRLANRVFRIGSEFSTRERSRRLRRPDQLSRYPRPALIAGISRR
jgi:hypothetical protein